MWGTAIDATASKQEGDCALIRVFLHAPK
jgi:hypothetical protein